MIIAAPNTGVIKASMRIVNNKLIVINGNIIFLFLKPSAANVLLVIKRLVNEIVVLTPAKITEIIKISCVPTPVYFIFDESGVIKVQPAAVNTRFEHLVT
jgi:hypothetical protein